jgi:hypothetical protein
MRQPPEAEDLAAPAGEGDAIAAAIEEAERRAQADEAVPLEPTAVPAPEPDSEMTTNAQAPAEPESNAEPQQPRPRRKRPTGQEELPLA